MINKFVIVGRAKQILHEEGASMLFRKILLFLKRFLFLYSRFDIYESNLDSPSIMCNVDNLVIRAITKPEEIIQLESDGLISEGINISRSKEVLAMNAILFCAFVGKELAHVTYVFTGKNAHGTYPFSFAMQYGDVVGMAATTAPKYRRKGIHLYTRSKVMYYLKGMGMSKAWDVQNDDNVAARNAIIKVGYYFWGRGYHIRLFYLFTIEWTKPKSHFHITFH